jgi:sugar phosphate isomerase/epimerase
MLAANRMVGAPRNSIHLGCQTNAWPINPQDFSSVLAVIRKLKDWGYEGFETGFANVQPQFGDPSAAKAAISATGMRFFGVHIFLKEYDPATLIAPAGLYERVAAGGASLGAERLILSGAPVRSQRDLTNKAEALNRAGEFAANRGPTLAYHNHDAEFRKDGAEIEGLLSATDPAKVGLVVDAGHAFEAHADIPAFIRKHSKRIVGFHLRDYKNDEQVPLGAGEFPLQKVVRAIRQTNWNGWILNEEERLTSKPGDVAAKPARDALFRAFRGRV